MDPEAGGTALTWRGQYATLWGRLARDETLRGGAMPLREATR